MLGIDFFCTCHLFPTWWSPYFLGCNNTCWDWHFPVPNSTTKDLNIVTPSCLLLGPTFWNPSGLVLSPIVGFFGRSSTQAWVCFAFSKCSFKFYVSMSLLLCMCKGRCVVINSSYHICISFIFSPFPYNTTYSSWLATPYSSPSFTMLMWSYHWRSKYPFVLVPFQEWTYNSPWCISRHYRNYCFGEWNTCLKGGLPPFPFSHPTTSGYIYD